MKITAAGWNRNCGDNVIASIDLKELQADANSTYGHNRPMLSLRRHPVRRERIMGAQVYFVANVRLGGDYGFKVGLSKSEIAHLFFQTHKEEVERFASLFPGLLPEPDAGEEAAA
jgi:hypothetical protein